MLGGVRQAVALFASRLGFRRFPAPALARANRHG
jgi:hypothetical protein